MTPSIRDILAPLDPYWDRIIRRPMSAREVDDLESQVGLPAPRPFRDYLRKVGLFQDLTMWGASSIEVHNAPSAFDSARKFLSQILPTKNADLFPFGGDGAGNEFCLPSADAVPCRVHFVDHETAKVSKRKDFTDWLQSVVAKVLRGIRTRPPNDRKAWCVQFSLPKMSFADLVDLLASVGKTKVIDSHWMNADTTDEGVRSTERRFDLNGACLKATQLECAEWGDPLLSFDMREALDQGLEHSQIRALDGLFKKKYPGYKLIDYGPLDLRKIEKAEPEGLA